MSVKSARHATHSQTNGDVQLAVMVPETVKDAVRRRAAEQRQTTRQVVLQALHQAGIPVAEAELADRRVLAAQRRVRTSRPAKPS